MFFADDADEHGSALEFFTCPVREVVFIVVLPSPRCIRIQSHIKLIELI
jgi:hypothetical protein